MRTLDPSASRTEHSSSGSAISPSPDSDESSFSNTTQKSDPGTLFKREEGDYFVRTKVKLGRTSVNTVEIVEGLKVGDEVILSDMSAQDGVDRIRLK